MIYFGNDHMSADQLPTKIRQRLHQGAESKVYIRADAHARCGSVMEVVHEVGSADIQDIAFLVDQKVARSPAPLVGHPAP
jgi:biopolymer transport protein ExbD